MTDALLWHRIQFALTITYHYLFPQLTMGLALIIVLVGLTVATASYLRTRAKLAGAARDRPAARSFGDHGREGAQ